MRAASLLPLVSLVLLVLFLSPALRAEDAPPAAAPVAPAAPGAPAEPGKPAWDAERMWFVTLLDPTQAWSKLIADLRNVAPADRRAAQAARAKAYLEAFEAAGAAAKPVDLGALVRFYSTAERYPEVATRLLEMLAVEGSPATDRDAAAQQLAALLAVPPAREALGAETLAKVTGAVRDYLAARTGEDGASVRGQLHRALAMDADQQDDDLGAIREYMLAAVEDPSLAAMAGRSVVHALQGSTHEIGGYDAARAGAAASLAVLRHLAALHLERSQAAGNEAAVRTAEAGVKMLAEAGKPLEVLGRAAPGWTVEKAWGDVTSLESLRGKVVMVDFWATWCPWCIKSFPAIRDLLRDYSEKGLVVVGVTATSSAVYEQRYDLDDDLKEKAAGAGPVKPAARLQGRGPDRDDGIPTLPPEEYRPLEQEVIGRFLENHRVTWPVLMVEASEPSAKFALSGWPHAVVIDREGRIRYLKPGALLRDRPEQVAAFRRVLEDLLAEPAPAAPAPAAVVPAAPAAE